MTIERKSGKDIIARKEDAADQIRKSKKGFKLKHQSKERYSEDEQHIYDIKETASVLESNRQITGRTQRVAK
jgi:hypothetical protein